MQRRTTTQRGYGAQHRKWRAAILAEQPLCACCAAVERVEASTVADHIVPRSVGGQQFDYDNGQGLCETCHNRKRAAEARGRQLIVVQGKGFVDVGPLGTQVAA